MLVLNLVVLVILGIASAIDMNTKKVPAVLSTALIFLVAFVNFDNLNFGILHLCFGILGLIFAYMLYEFDFIGGVADIKIIIVLSMLAVSIPSLLMIFILIVTIGMLYKLYFRFVLEHREDEEIPFVLCLALITAFSIIGGFI